MPRFNPQVKKKATKTAPEPVVFTAAEIKALHEAAGKITNDVLSEVIAKAVAGAKIIDICSAGDSSIKAKTSEQNNDNLVDDENKKKHLADRKTLNNGIAFPTTVSVNNCVAHFSPEPETPDAELTLKEGDVAKIQLGAHVGGYPAVVAHTLVVGATADKPATGVKADVIQAAHSALQAAIRTIVEGKKNMDVTNIVSKVAKAYDTKPVKGMLSHQQLADGKEGSNQIIINPSPEHMTSFTRANFKKDEVYVVDILISTGDGEVREGTSTTTIYRRSDTRYNLKLRTASATLSTLEKVAKQFPCHIQSLLEKNPKARMGLPLCSDSRTVIPHGIMYESKGAIIAQFLATVVVSEGGNAVVTDPHFNASLIKSEKTIEDKEVADLLA